MHKHKLTVIRFNLFIVLAEGILVFWQYLQQRSEPQSAFLWGSSALRLTILAFIGVVLLVLFLFLIKLTIDSVWIEKAENVVDSAMGQVLILWIMLLSIGLAYLALFISDHQLDSIASYREASRPLLAWFGAVSLQLLVSFILVQDGTSEIWLQFRDVLIPSSIALVLVGLSLGFIFITRMGLTPVIGFWQDPGVPIILPQVLLIWFIGTLFYFWSKKTIVSQDKNFDLIVGFSIWMVTFLLWLSQPLSPSYNSLKPISPNYQSYPFGDSLFFDLTAHEFLIGRPIPDNFYIKPVYSLFLALIHIFGGDNYNLVVAIQVAILALVPVIVYFIVSSMFGRSTGLIAALLFALRERNGIVLSNVIQVSNAKLLMSEIFATGLIALLLLFMFRWLYLRQDKMLVTMGGCLGLLVLTRLNSIVLFPVILMGVIVLSAKVHAVPIRKNLLVFIGAFLVTVSPWVLRSFLVGDSLDSLDTLPAYTGLVNDIYDLLLRQPGETAQIVVSHYLHNAINSFIYLPHSFLAGKIKNYVTDEPFWHMWSGSLEPHNVVFLVINMIVIALGSGALWRKDKYGMLIPLFLGIGYNIGVSVNFFSGWRYVQPVDWITLIFYSTGLMQLVYLVEFIMSRKMGRERVLLFSQPVHVVYSDKSSRVIVALIPFVFISGMLVMGHKLFAFRSVEIADVGSAEDILMFLKSDRGAIHDVVIPDIWTDDLGVIVHGRSLYPLFWDAGSGEINYLLPGYASKTYPRLGFFLLGEQTVYVALRMNLPPRSFPDGADVTVMGCKRDDGYIDALAVLLGTEPPTLYTREPFPDLHCPIPEP